jgi:ubiquinone/menaquinone biosynthesis C-methylase UbiE
MSAYVQLYDQLAADYERTRVPRFRPFVKKLLQLYDTRPGSHVLDAGCGTGLAATMVAPRVGHGGKVVGVDLSKPMLEIARNKAQGFGFDQCEFVSGDISQLNYAGESFDLVICSFALWGEPYGLFTEFYRVLRPHGALLIQNWESERDRVSRAIHATLHEFATSAPDEHLAALRDDFKQHAAQWTEMNDPGDYERVLRAAGFRQASAQWFSNPAHFASVDELIEFYNLGVRSRAEIQAMDVDTRSRYFAALKEKLQPPETAGGMDIEWRAVQALALK